MGLKIRKFIDTYAPESITTVELNSGEIKVIAIDASIYIYKFSHNAKGRNACLLKFYNMFKRFLQHNIVPILVFDGPHPTLKEFTMTKRKEIKLPTINIDENIYDDLKQLCLLLNITQIRSPGEADKLCTALIHNGIADAVLSGDYDLLMFDSERLCLYSYGDDIQCITLSKLLECAKLTYDEFVTMCILTGTDYNADEKHVISTTAYKKVKEMTKEELISFDEKYKPILDYIYEDMELPDITYITKIDKSLIKWDSLSEFMISKCNCRNDTISKHKTLFGEE
jgi:5'-3' exonuclease